MEKETTATAGANEAGRGSQNDGEPRKLGDVTAILNEFAVLAADVPDIDRRYFEAKRERIEQVVGDQPTFNAISLTEWLDIIRMADVPHVPAREVARIPCDVIARFDHPTPGDKPHWATLASATKALPDNHMLRWDCCAGLDVKLDMDRGRCDQHTGRSLSPDDPRFFDILFGYPAAEIPIHARPWVDAIMVESHPLEFRVFVRNSEIVGVSSYYPQRPLPQTPQVDAAVQACKMHTQTVIDLLGRTGRVPWGLTYSPKWFATEKVSATLDFLVDTEGATRFLEAGPPFGAGAHPCCFEGRDIEGVALAKI